MNTFSRRAMVCLFCACTFFFTGCQQYGEVSPKSYEYATALYSVCNRKDEARLAETRQSIEQSVQAGEMTQSEADDLLQMIATAEAGDWQEAMQDARTMMSEQNGR